MITRGLKYVTANSKTWTKCWFGHDVKSIISWSPLVFNLCWSQCLLKVHASSPNFTSHFSSSLSLTNLPIESLLPKLGTIIPVDCFSHWFRANLVLIGTPKEFHTQHATIYIFLKINKIMGKQRLEPTKLQFWTINKPKITATATTRQGAFQWKRQSERFRNHPKKKKNNNKERRSDTWRSESGVTENVPYMQWGFQQDVRAEKTARGDHSRSCQVGAFVGPASE